MKRIKFLFAIGLMVFANFAFAFSNNALAASNVIGNFETGTLEGWDENAKLSSGYNSNYSLRVSNPPNGAAGTRKDFNKDVLKGFDKLEFDIDLHGSTILPGDASALVVEQAGWKWVSLYHYVKNGFNGWQHITIPLSDIKDLNKEMGIAYINFRFWNYIAGNYDIDNITLTGSDNPGTTLTQPSNLSGQAISSSQINISWSGSDPQYNVYRNGQKIDTVGQPSYSNSGLSGDTNYSYYVTATNGIQESAPSNTIDIKTSQSNQGGGKLISNFESGTLEGWNEEAKLINGYNSNHAIRVTNPALGSAGTRKDFNSEITKGFSKIEFDLNLNGNTIMPGDAAAVIFEQGGWKIAPLISYVNNSQIGWQHVVVPFSSISNFNPNSGIVYMNIRFWNYKSGNYDIDNIMLTDGSVSEPPVVGSLETPTNLSGQSQSAGQVSLSWSGKGPHYRILRDDKVLASTDQTSFTDTTAYPGATYKYAVLAYNGSSESSPTSSINVTANITTPKWQFRSIDSQIASKYWGSLDENQIRHLVQADKALGAKYIAVSANYDYPDLIRRWADVIHSEGLNVWFRAHWNEWDNWEKKEIARGITSDEYLRRTKQFILDHPNLYKDGDAFTMANESENAAWWTGIDSGPFQGWEGYRSFVRNQVVISNEAFNQIGLGGKIKTNWINMNGWVAWNILDQQTVNTLGQLTLDHIIDWTEDIQTYKDGLFVGKDFADGNRYYGYDEYYNKWHVPMMAGEWGYSTFNQNLSIIDQQNMIASILEEFAKRPYFIGVNYWIDTGHASRLLDSTNLLDYTPRPAAKVLSKYYQSY